MVDWTLFFLCLGGDGDGVGMFSLSCLTLVLLVLPIKLLLILDIVLQDLAPSTLSIFFYLNSLTSIPESIEFNLISHLIPPQLFLWPWGFCIGVVSCDYFTLILLPLINPSVVLTSVINTLYNNSFSGHFGTTLTRRLRQRSFIRFNSYKLFNSH